MDKKEAQKVELEHMENRTQWHDSDVKRVEALRNAVSAEQNDGKLSQHDKNKNKVKHQH